MKKITTTVTLMFCLTAIFGCTSRYVGHYFAEGVPQDACVALANCQQTYDDFDVNYRVSKVSEHRFVLEGSSHFTYQNTASVYESARQMILKFALLSDDTIVCVAEVSVSGSLRKKQHFKKAFACDYPFDSSYIFAYHGYVSEI